MSAMALRKFRLCWRPVAPSIIGLCLGITFSLLYAPFLDEQGCSFLKNTDKEQQQIKLRETKSFHELQERSVPRQQQPNAINMNSGGVPGPAHRGGGPVPEGPKKLEPRLKLQGQGNPLDPAAGGVPGGGIKVHKLVRPRYISTELGIREKLFVAVLTSPESLDTLAVALNKSVAHHVTKMVFFTDKKGSNYPGSGMSIVGFSLATDQNLLPLFILKYLGEHYSTTYDYYMFVSDKTYLRGEKIFDMVSDISISEDVHFGATVLNEQGKCTIDGGIIISQSILSKTLSQLHSCYNNKKVKTMDNILESCILHGSGQQCENNAGDQIYKFIQVTDFDYQDLEILQDSKVKSSFAIAPMPDDISVYKIHKFFCQMDLNETLQEIEHTKEEILHLSQFAPGGRSSLSWPIGLPAPFNPKNRFDVIHWQYFTATHLYFDSDYSNEKELKGVNKMDVDEILSFSIQKLNERYKKRYSFSHLVNGYRRFDPFRGMEYILDLSMLDTHAHNAVVEKRVHLVRPLGQVEIIPMPYVTENTQVNLVLPVTDEDKDEFGSFLDAYAHTCLDTGDNTNLLIIFIYKNNSKVLKDDKFYVLKSMITYYDNKYQNKGKITWTKLETRDTYVSDLMIMDTITKRFSPEALLLFCTVGMELTTDFFNRVRMNNIIDWQVFFPIAFWQYKPNLIYNKRPYPTTIELKRNVGHFDVYSYDHSSFYNKDFQNGRKGLTWEESRKFDLFKMFLRQKKLHVFRAIEPTLKHRYKAINCDRSSPAYIYERCNKRKLEALANRPQLARLIFEYEEKLEEARKKNPLKKTVVLDSIKSIPSKTKDNKKKIVH